MAKKLVTITQWPKNWSRQLNGQKIGRRNDKSMTKILVINDQNFSNQ